MRRALVLATLLAAVFAAPASAATDRHVELIAYGEGVTRCTVDIEKRSWVVDPSQTQGTYRAGGWTACTAPVQQSGYAFMPLSNGNTLDGAVCSGFKTNCFSTWSSRGTGPAGTITYDVSLVAPPGQGWIATPEHCAGGGTDKLQCRFVVEVTAVA